MNSQELWILIQSAYNTSNTNHFWRHFPNQDISIVSNDNGYRVDLAIGDNSISLAIKKEFSIVNSTSKYEIDLMKNGTYFRQTQQELIWKIIQSEFIPRLREIKINQLIF